METLQCGYTESSVGSHYLGAVCLGRLAALGFMSGQDGRVICLQDLG